MTRSLRSVGIVLAGLPTLLGASPAPDEASLLEAVSLRSRALADMEAGNFGRAAEALDELAIILPDNLLPPVNRAICAFRLGRQSEALEQLAKARSIAPDNPQLLYATTRILENEPSQRALWAETVERFVELHPGDPRPHYLRSVVAARDGRHEEAASALGEALRRDPENLVLLADALVERAAAGDLDGVEDALNGIEDRLDGFDERVQPYADRIRDAVWSGSTDGVRPPTIVIRNVVRPTDLYQQHLLPLLGRGGPDGDLFPQLDFVPPLPAAIQGGADIEVTLRPIEVPAGARSRPVAIAIAADAETARERLLVAAGEQPFFTRLGGQVEPGPHALDTGDRLRVVDMNQDEIDDVLAAGPSRGVRLLEGRADGWADAKVLSGPDPALAGAWPVDADHDGDPDIFVARRGRPDSLFLNTGGDEWPDVASDMGLAGGERSSSDLAVGDLDQDGDLDLVVARRNGPPVVLVNDRARRFEMASGALGLGDVWAADDYDELELPRVATADIDRDGRFDLLSWGPSGAMLLRFTSTGSELARISDRRWDAAAIGDVDNDGDVDVIAATPSGLELVRNVDGELRPESGAELAPGARHLELADLDEDGDLDVAAATDEGLRWWENDGGNRNHWVRLSLRGLNTNNAKNHTRGLHARVEARVAGRLTTVLGNGGVNHLGLGSRRQADVVRVVWSNGLAQSWQLVAADQTLIEQQVLKGSCPFVYTWDGERFAFGTDLMWRSPLGMVLPDGSDAPHQSARDFVRIPAEALRPDGGRLWLQITEELWETAYVDRVRLTAIDHPDDRELVVDERFRPPPYPASPSIVLPTRLIAPSRAIGASGLEVTEALRRQDGRYVDDLRLGRYQGQASPHQLLIELDRPAGTDDLHLVLWGWIFPTDTSINVALSQNRAEDVAPPRLEIQHTDGDWRIVPGFMGFPSGKDKAVVVPLDPALLPSEGQLRLRVTTSQQIYWDRVALAVGNEGPSRSTTLDPSFAHLHPRGYSREQRASASSPHRFDYEKTTVTPRFPPMTGWHTRLGEVTDLLLSSDDLSVVMAPGDELSIELDASILPPLPDGWRRDWILHTDGWVKDADINTTGSATVEPLPYHGMGSYPARPQHRFPDTELHRRYLETYQTRYLDGATWRTGGDGP